MLIFCYKLTNGQNIRAEFAANINNFFPFFIIIKTTFFNPLSSNYNQLQSNFEISV